MGEVQHPEFLDGALVLLAFAIELRWVSILASLSYCSRRALDTDLSHSFTTRTSRGH